MKWTVFECGGGWSAAQWEDERLQRVTFGHASPLQAVSNWQLGDGEPDAVDDFIAGVTERLQRFMDGEFSVDLNGIALDLDWATPFQRAIVDRCRRIPVGSTLSYGELAARAGFPGAARAVGQVMARNRFPLIVPCHRVVAANQGLGGYSAPDGLATKKRLLQAEAQFCSAVATGRRAPALEPVG